MFGLGSIALKILLMVSISVNKQYLMDIIWYLIQYFLNIKELSLITCIRNSLKLKKKLSIKNLRMVNVLKIDRIPFHKGKKNF